MKKNSNSNNEYVVYNVVSSKDVDFANNQSTMQRVNVDVAYYAPKKSLSQEYVDLIKETMLNAGWTVFTPEMIVPSVTKDNITGIVIEFVKEQVV